MADLPSTTLGQTLTAAIGWVRLASLGTVRKDDLIVIEREAMAVLDASQNPVRVRRGAASTRAAEHVVGATVYYGSPDRFFSVDPVGVPAAYPLANPWINLREGRVWVAQGDVAGPGAAARRWQLQSSAFAPGALGILVAPTVTP